MTMILTLKPAIKSDYLRGGPLQLKELQTRTPSHKYLHAVQPTDKIECERIIETKGNFIEVELTKPVAKEVQWWIFKPYWVVPQEPAKKVFAADSDLPTFVKLSVPYLSQLDNENHPYGTCNITSLSMALGFFGHPLFNAEGRQLEDQLFQLCENKRLDRHAPTDLAQLVNGFGYSDDFRADAKWPDVKRWLAGGNPCVVHGWFTVPSGHIITIIGYNETGYIVNDPYGEWHSWGYDTSVSGEGLTYSYGMMERLCGPNGDLWMHFLSK